MGISIRRTTPADALAIATIRVASWRTAYDGLIAPELLARMDIAREADRRATHWDEHHVDPRGAEFLAEVDGEPVGWAVTGASRDPGAVRLGELYALYALPSHWSTGVGHHLMVAAEAALRDAGFATAHLWVLDGNERAASFYERHGWREDGTIKLDERIVGNTGLPALRERRRVRDLGQSVLPNA